MTDEEYEQRQQMLDRGSDFLDNLKDTVHTQYLDIQDLKREKEIMTKYMQLIVDIGFDYDGYNKSEDLKELIDEIVEYATLGIECNDKKVMYQNETKKYNILMEEIEDK